MPEAEMVSTSSVESGKSEESTGEKEGADHETRDSFSVGDEERLHNGEEVTAEEQEGLEEWRTLPCL